MLRGPESGKRTDKFIGASGDVASWGFVALPGFRGRSRRRHSLHLQGERARGENGVAGKKSFDDREKRKFTIKDGDGVVGHL